MTKNDDKRKALDVLRGDLHPGDTVYTVLRHVSASGMTRWIDCYRMAGEPEYLSYWIGHAIGSPVNSGKHEGVKRGGCGMDMGFDLVYSLSHALFPDGFECIGKRCPSNDHSNGDRDYSPHPHESGGYALRHRWL